MSRRINAVLRQLSANPTAGESKQAPVFTSSPRHGGQLAAYAISEHGVDHVFTLTGGHISPILVGLDQRGVKVHDVRDEATTVFAADAYYRVTGKPGVAIATAGPGIANTLTAVKNAGLAESAVVVLGGATAMVLKGRGSLQDIDQFAMMRPHCRACFSISRVADIVPILRRAFRIAAGEAPGQTTATRPLVPGVVFVEFPLETIWPEDMFAAVAGVGGGEKKQGSKSPPLSKRLTDWYMRRHIQRVFHSSGGLTAPPKPTDTPVFMRTQGPPDAPPLVKCAVASSDVDYVARVIADRQTKRPVFVLGSGAVLGGVAHSVAHSLRSLGIPCYLSGMARGLLGAKSPLHMRHRRRWALGHCDVLVLLGVPQDFRLDYGRIINKNCTYIHVHLNGLTVRNNQMLRRSDRKIVGHPASLLYGVSRRLRKLDGPVRWSSWMAELGEQQRGREQEITAMIPAGPPSTDQKCHPLQVCRVIDQVLPDNAVLITDGGDFVGTAAYTVRPRAPLTWLDPGVFGTLGCGGGFALGVGAACPQSEVWILFGDGACGWSLIEFETYVRRGIPVIAVVGNDGCWSQMWRDQVRVLKNEVACNLTYARYDKAVEGLGGKGLLVESIEQLKPTLLRARALYAQGHAVLVNVLLGKSKFREGSISL